MKVEIIKKPEHEEAKIFIDESENFNFQEKRELKLKEGWYKKSIEIFQCEEAEELTNVSLESIKLLCEENSGFCGVKLWRKSFQRNGEKN